MPSFDPRELAYLREQRLGRRATVDAKGVEIRGSAEALFDVDPPMAGMSRELIRITPRWIGSWGIASDAFALSARHD